MGSETDFKTTDKLFFSDGNLCDEVKIPGIEVLNDKILKDIFVKL